jgi:hypothetical protein
MPQFLPYTGNSSAESSKSVKVNYAALVFGGLEYIGFDDLNASLLAASLAEGAKSALTKALDAYHSLNDALKTRGSTVLDVLRDPATYSDEYAKFQSWLSEVYKFKGSYGDGMVVAVA